VLGVFGLAVSAGSAALVGIRAYVEMEMLEDLEGWARLFRAKVVEA
jgi:hypothetical protein